MLSKTAVHRYEGTNVTLGTAAGRLFRVGVMTISDAGDSDLVSLIWIATRLHFDCVLCSDQVYLCHRLFTAHRCRKRDRLNRVFLNRPICGGSCLTRFHDAPVTIVDLGKTI